MKKIGIIAALPGELKPLVKGWQPHGKLYSGRIGETECIAIAGGMGAPAATRACEQILAEGGIEALVSYGWAGALSCGLKPPQAVAIHDIIDSKTSEHFVTDMPAGHRLVTLDHVARHEEKRQIAQEFQAPLVDMEAAAVARIAAAHHLAFYCFKGISDGANDKLPDFNRFLDKDSQLRMSSLVAYALLHPSYWKPLQRLGKQSQSAARNLESIITENIGKRL